MQCDWLHCDAPLSLPWSAGKICRFAEGLTSLAFSRLCVLLWLVHVSSKGTTTIWTEWYDSGSINGIALVDGRRCWSALAKYVKRQTTELYCKRWWVKRWRVEGLTRYVGIHFVCSLDKQLFLRLLIYLFQGYCNLLRMSCQTARIDADTQKPQQSRTMVKPR